MSTRGLIIGWALLAACGGAEFDRSAAPIVGGTRLAAAHAEVLGLVPRFATPGGPVLGRCTATLIAPDVALTAAHCLSTELGQANLVVLVQKPSFSLSDLAQLQTGTVAKSAASFQLHPDFDPAGTAYDLALVFLDLPFDGAAVASLARDMDGASLRVGRVLRAVGYGTSERLVEGDAPPSSGWIRTALDLPVFTVADSELQTRVSDDEAVCLGDLGAPAFLERSMSSALVGVMRASTNTPPGCRTTGIFTRSDRYRPWIDSNMDAACSDGRRSAEACVAQRLSLPSAVAPPDPTLPPGEPFTPLDSPAQDVGDGPAPDDGGCVCARPRASGWALEYLAALLLFLRLQRRR